jgi:hypothetical protein
MADRPVQTYATHAHRPTLTGVGGLFAILALGWFIVAAFRGGVSALVLGGICLTVAVMVLLTISRVYIVKLQDRIIRLEMQLRLERLGLGPQFRRLSTPQIVALRFASDAELADLVHRAIAERLSSIQIKQAIRDWQGDYHRT